LDSESSSPSAWITIDDRLRPFDPIVSSFFHDADLVYIHSLTILQPVHYNHLIFRNLTIKGSLLGTAENTKEMVDFVAAKGSVIKNDFGVVVETLLKKSKLKRVYIHWSRWKP
jgi:hypothetical protein